MVFNNNNLTKDCNFRQKALELQHVMVFLFMR